MKGFSKSLGILDVSKRSVECFSKTSGAAMALAGGCPGGKRNKTGNNELVCASRFVNNFAYLQSRRVSDDQERSSFPGLGVAKRAWK